VGCEVTARPACVSDKHIEFLDELRESGKTNMFGARPYLMREFPSLSKDDAMAVCVYWMESFEERAK
jgi:hypothetical protein